MYFSFNANTFRDMFHRASGKYLEVSEKDTGASAVAAESQSAQDYVTAMNQAIDVMAQAGTDSTVQNSVSAPDTGFLEETDISKIGQYALDILEAMVAYGQNKNGQQDRELIRLSVPIALWVARHGGKLSQIDMPVNSLAGYANEVTEPHQLEELAKVIREILDACNDEIKRDVEQSNMMRPWRILNLNYGIVATRSHQPRLIEQAYDALINNLPQDARQFFKEGLQQMDAIDYPQEVREVVERYNNMWGSDGVLH